MLIRLNFLAFFRGTAVDGNVVEAKARRFKMTKFEVRGVGLVSYTWKESRSEEVIRLSASDEMNYDIQIEIYNNG
jgi:hypothetical protein